MVALFLRKGASWNDWERHYPSSPRFKLVELTRLKVGTIIKQNAPYIPEERYPQILRLLEKGGRAPMSTESDVGAFCVAHDGGLYAMMPAR